MKSEEEILNILIEYQEKNEQAKILTDEAAKLNAEIKEYMKGHSLKSLSSKNVVATFSTQERTSTLVEKMIERMKVLGFEQAIKQVETLNEPEIQNLIYEKKLQPQQIEDCIEVKKVEILRISKTKKVENNEKFLDTFHQQCLTGGHK